MAPKSVKCILLGNGGVGKTSFYITYTTKEFPTVYTPTVFDNYATKLQIDDQEIEMGLWETIQGEDAARLRPLSYPQTDVFILAFAVNNKRSYNDIRSVWLPEIKHHEPKVPILLLGTKIDLRDSEVNQEEWISTEVGEKTAKTLGIYKYLECSSLTSTNLDKVIDEAARIGLIHSQEAEEREKKKKTKCSIL